MQSLAGLRPVCHASFAVAFLPRPQLAEGLRTGRLLECKDGYCTFGIQLPGIGERTLAGIMIWELGQDTRDRDQSLLAAVARWLEDDAASARK